MKKILFILSLLIAQAGFAQSYLTQNSSSATHYTAEKQPEFLSPEDAFVLNYQFLKDNSIEVAWTVAEKYHLYHSSLRFEIISKDVKLGSYQVPPGKKTFLPALNQTMEEHSGVTKIKLPLNGQGKFVLKAYAQGCADAGLCYPPFVRELSLNKK